MNEVFSTSIGWVPSVPLHCPRNLSSFTRPQGGESESHEFRGFTEVVDPTPGYPCYLRKSNCRPNLDLPNGRLGAWTAGEICWNCQPWSVTALHFAGPEFRDVRGTFSGAERFQPYETHNGWYAWDNMG
jgi:hypothetical protein